MALCNMRQRAARWEYVYGLWELTDYGFVTSRNKAALGNTWIPI